MEHEKNGNDVSAHCLALLRRAHTADASDIHFVPREDDVLIELRIRGYLCHESITSHAEARRAVNHFKFLAGMDIAQTRLPQSGAMPVVLNGVPISLRFSTLPTPWAESLVIRLLPQDRALGIHDLSIFKECVSGLKQLLNYESGLILISGPTGSGKTTTLYTLLHAFQRKYHARVITLEDPIEERHDTFVQMEINERSQLTYASGFKALLRHDPDVVMIGEIRDEETARVAVKAALSGHLVLSTVHASHALATIERLNELGLQRFDLKETLVAVIAERLVTILCPSCGAQCSPDCANKRHRKRTGLFEIVSGMPLHRQLTSIPRRGVQSDYKTIDDYMAEGISLGLIEKNAWQKGGAVRATEIPVDRR
ncbi:MAG: competence type IV pilus ATPase ComGA [Sporolactobacillus sp.]